ncbi:hypothetical protein NQZ68_036962 [Dissostichus eleginoides]|nr:hypothetical protein NQZ68_036962 [Dissostichus eleginoides]
MPVCECGGVDRLTTCMWWVVSAVGRCLRHRLPLVTPQTICPSWCRGSEPKRAPSARSVPHCAELLQVVPGPEPCC